MKTLLIRIDRIIFNIIILFIAIILGAIGVLELTNDIPALLSIRTLSDIIYRDLLGKILVFPFCILLLVAVTMKLRNMAIILYKTKGAAIYDRILLRETGIMKSPRIINLICRFLNPRKVNSEDKINFY